MKRYLIYPLAIIAIAFIFIAASSLKERVTIPTIGDYAPSFEAMSTQGKVSFPSDFYGKWKILFSHPADFTPVCTSEIISIVENHDEFKKEGCEFIGLSTDGVQSHNQWIKSMEEIALLNDKEFVVKFPIIADVNMQVSSLYGMIHNSVNESKTIRSVFIIDPENKIRSIMFYPMSTGRNTQELLRLVKAMKVADKHNVATPADWNPGDMVLIPTPEDVHSKAAERFYYNAGEDYHCPSWYMCLKDLKE